MRDAQQRAQAAEDALTGALDGYLDRLIGVVGQRLGGPKARKGTRWWAPSGREAKHALAPVGVETKALDTDFIVPRKLVEEVSDNIRPVALRVAVDAAEDTARRLGAHVPDTGGDGMFAIDQQAVNNAVEDAIARILGVAQRHAQELREEITRADSEADSLDEVLDRVEAAHRKGGNWVRMSGRTLANALANDAAMRSALALGVTHAQWLSRRDDRVRATHRMADGQTRRIGDKYHVGSFELRFPGDPEDLPESWPEIAGCRCSLLFRKPKPETTAALRLLDRQTTPGEVSGAALRLLAAAASSLEGVPAPFGVPLPEMSGVRLTLPEPVVGYRNLTEMIDTIPGQWLSMAGPITLALQAPARLSEAAPVLAVVIPADTVVTVVGGSMVLAEGTPLEVLGVSPTVLQAQAV